MHETIYLVSTTIYEVRTTNHILRYLIIEGLSRLQAKPKPNLS
jgi:hypothetical protein